MKLNQIHREFLERLKEKYGKGTARNVERVAPYLKVEKKPSYRIVRGPGKRSCIIPESEDDLAAIAADSGFNGMVATLPDRGKAWILEMKIIDGKPENTWHPIFNFRFFDYLCAKDEER